MKIATWNVNSIRMRLAHLLEFLALHQPDVVALQETKVQDHQFPVQAIQSAGYSVIFSGQKTFNGVALLTKKLAEEIVVDMPKFNDPARRLMAATIETAIGHVRIVNVYVPNGSEVGSEKFIYKLNWLQQLREFLQAELSVNDQLIMLGDFNIAPEDRDVHDPIAWKGSVLVSEPERLALKEIMSQGLVDVFRQFDQPIDRSYSWWDYRTAGFWRNEGLRIDLILATSRLASKCQQCGVDIRPRKLKSPSDHAPVMAEFL